MTSAAPTFSQIKAQVAAIRQKIPNARVIGIRASGRWTGERHKQDGPETYLIDQCDSPLAMRIALREPDGEGTTKVLITGLDDKNLGEDILLRLTKRRLFPIDSWQIVKSLFQAQAIDPRLTRHRWIAECLMDWIPTGGYPPVSGGFLDAETVWPILLHRGIGLVSERPDLLAILKWSISSDRVRLFREIPEHFREGIVDWLSGVAGPTTRAILDCVHRTEGPDALPVGLAAGVVFHSKASGRVEKAVGKMEERFFGGASPNPHLLARWSAAATEVVRLQLTDPKEKRAQLQRADEILQEIGADSFAYISDTSPLGFDQRLATFGDRLAQSLASHDPQSVEHLAEARRDVLEHDRSDRETRRLDRVQMALRLVRCLVHVRSQDAEPQSLEDAVSYQLSEGGFVDWARLTLRAGDPVRQLSEAYTQLFEQVTAVREEQSKRFAELLKDWTAAGSTGESPVCVEKILEKVVAPLAAHVPVLVIVIDGMSMAVCRELVSDISRFDWVTLCPEGHSAMATVGLATIPSITEVSRTSLLCGQLRKGHSGDERSGFESHAALLKHCRSGSPPMLFHKASLQDGDDAVLANEVRKAISSSHRRVVGVVVNAVDDHLSKGEQIDIHWSRDQIKVLPSLLHEAKVARRLVVLLSDHGHVLDHKTQGKAHEGGERWRLDEGEPGETELRVSGSRVVIPESKTLIAPWTERLRYGMPKNGYHGGLTPQEMVVPIAVLCSTDVYPEGWSEAPIDTPAWWDEPVSKTGETREPPPKIKPIKPKPTGLLFDMDTEEPVTKPEPKEKPAAEPMPDWVTALLASPIFDQQKQLAGRTVPAETMFVQLLTTLDNRGGKMTSAALARAINYPPIRLRGLLAVVQRVLNIDGYSVVTRDEASDTIELNRDLLCKQFDLV